MGSPLSKFMIGALCIVNPMTVLGVHGEQIRRLPSQFENQEEDAEEMEERRRFYDLSKFEDNQAGTVGGALLGGALAGGLTKLVSSKLLAHTKMDPAHQEMASNMLGGLAGVGGLIGGADLGANLEAHHSAGAGKRRLAASEIDDAAQKLHMDVKNKFFL